MKRQFPYLSLTSGGTPQPVFGTTLSAAVGPVGSPGNSLQSLPVAAYVGGFVAGDWIILDPLGSNPERLLIEAVPDSTHIKVQGVQYAHASGVFVQLADSVVSVYIQTKPGNSGIIYVGGQGMSKTGAFYALLIAVAATGVQPIEWTDYIGDGQNVLDTADYWFDGTTGDSILPSFTTR